MPLRRSETWFQREDEMPVSSEWNPIESAPKDGKLVILSDGESVKEGKWWDDYGGMWSTDFEPTHWQHKPSPPDPPKGGEGDAT